MIQDNDYFNPWSIEPAVIRLARYYRGYAHEDDLRRLLLKYKETVESKISTNEAIIGSMWLQKLYNVLQDFGLNEEAKQILVQIMQIGPDIKGEMKSIETTLKIDDDKYRQFLHEITDGGVDASLARIAASFIPRYKNIEAEVLKQSKETPLIFLFKTSILDPEGRPIATIGSIEDDLIGHIVKYGAQHIEIQSLFLTDAIKHCIKIYNITPEALFNYLMNSPVFTPERGSILLAGLRAYFDSNPIAAIHILIPQIEAAIRNLIELNGGEVLRQNQSGGFNYKTLEDIIKDPRFINTYEPIGEDVSFFLRLLLTDQRGINQRNNVCHGIVQEGHLNMQVASRIIQILLILAQIRIPENR